MVFATHAGGRLSHNFAELSGVADDVFELHRENLGSGSTAIAQFLYGGRL
jgi:hypothetical protein